MELKTLLSQKVSFQKNTWSSISKELTLEEVIQMTIGNGLKPHVEKLRGQYINDSEAYKVEKLRLPAVTFCGTFDGSRKKEYLNNYNRLVVLDIDKLSKEKLAKTRADLENDEYAFSYWNSPSNHGIKGLVSLEYSFELNPKNIDEAHKSAFIKLQEYYRNKYDIVLDDSGSDTTRLCFLSYDESLILKANCKPFPIQEEDLQKFTPKKETEKEKKVRSTSKQDALYNPKGRNNNTDRQAIRMLVKFLERKRKSITSDYGNWYRVAFAIANTFTYDIGERYYLELCKLDGNRYDEVACKNMLVYCYENSNGGLKYATIEFLAKEQGYKNRLLERSVS